MEESAKLGSLTRQLMDAVTTQDAEKIKNAGLEMLTFTDSLVAGHRDVIRIWQCRASSSLILKKDDLALEATRELLRLNAFDASNDPSLKRLFTLLDGRGFIEKALNAGSAAAAADPTTASPAPVAPATPVSNSPAPAPEPKPAAPVVENKPSIPAPEVKPVAAAPVQDERARIREAQNADGRDNPDNYRGIFTLGNPEDSRYESITYRLRFQRTNGAWSAWESSKFLRGQFQIRTMPATTRAQVAYTPAPGETDAVMEIEVWFMPMGLSIEGVKKEDGKLYLFNTDEKGKMVLVAK